VGTLADAAAGFAAADAVRPAEGFDTSLRLTSRTVGSPVAAVLDGAGAVSRAMAAFAAGARILELDSVESALQASIVLDLVRASGALPDDNAFTGALLVLKLPPGREQAEAVLEDVGRSTASRWTLAAQLTPEQTNALGTTRPLNAVALTSSLDAAGEDFARAILQEWGDDLVLELPPDAPPATIVPALERLRAVAESSGCTFAPRVRAGASPELLGALAASAANGMPVWIAGIEPEAAIPSLSRGASIVSPHDARAARDVWDRLVESGLALGARRTSDLVLFGAAPDDAMRAAAELQFGKDTWLVSPVKNAVLALKRLTEARGGSVDTPLARESLASPPKECCLYIAEEPDLKEAATGWLYDLWVRETMRRRLGAG
jgi:hypothetical protein